MVHKINQFDTALERSVIDFIMENGLEDELIDFVSTADKKEMREILKGD
jgi:hypothetical protein